MDGQTHKWTMIVCVVVDGQCDGVHDDLCDDVGEGVFDCVYDDRQTDIGGYRVTVQLKKFYSFWG